MKKILFMILATVTVSFFYSCYYDKGNILYPEGGSGICDTAAVTYSQKIVPLLRLNCYSCHTAGSAGGGITMGNYTADKAIAVNGKLYGTVNHASGFSPMPKGAVKMTSCQVATIKKWIDGGALNN